MELSILTDVQSINTAMWLLHVNDEKIRNWKWTKNDSDGGFRSVCHSIEPTIKWSCDVCACACDLSGIFPWSNWTKGFVCMLIDVCVCVYLFGCCRLHFCRLKYASFGYWWISQSLRNSVQCCASMAKQNREKWTKNESTDLIYSSWWMKCLLCSSTMPFLLLCINVPFYPHQANRLANNLGWKSNGYTYKIYSVFIVCIHFPLLVLFFFAVCLCRIENRRVYHFHACNYIVTIQTSATKSRFNAKNHMVTWNTHTHTQTTKVKMQFTRYIWVLVNDGLWEGKYCNKGIDSSMALIITTNKSNQ